jgi:hypothetical protein
MRFSVVSALCIVVLSPLTLVAETYRNEDYQFQIEVPAGWSPMTYPELQMATKLAQQAAGPSQSVKYVAGYRMRRDITAPYFLVQIMSGSPTGQTFEQIEAELKKTLPDATRSVQAKLSDYISDLNVGQAKIDRDRARMVVRMSMGGTGGGSLECISFTNFGSKSVICLHCYASPKYRVAMQPQFAALADSFQWSPGFEFKENSSAGLDVTDSAASAGIIGGVLGGLAGAVIWTIKKMLGSRSSDYDLITAPTAQTAETDGLQT